MKKKSRKDRAFLLATAKAIAQGLKVRTEGTRLKVRVPTRTGSTNTNGWSAIIGNLGKGQPRLEIWFDYFAGYSQRKLYACFRSEKKRSQILTITKRVARRLWPARTITEDDTEKEKHLALAKRLARSEFNSPVLEKYSGGGTFYGIYDPTRESVHRVSPHFYTRAVAFYEDVVRALPNAKAEDEYREVYPQIENRKLVAAHLQRERSKLLAAECKIRDNYQCQACGFRFENAYGKLGAAFAEAHHLVPLGRIKESVRTRIEDLKTVCANCHRMLHRMKGRRDDIKKLNAILTNRRR